MTLSKVERVQLEMLARKLVFDAKEYSEDWGHVPSDEFISMIDCKELATFSSLVRRLFNLSCEPFEITVEGDITSLHTLNPLTSHTQPKRDNWIVKRYVDGWTWSYPTCNGDRFVSRVNEWRLLADEVVE